MSREFHNSSEKVGALGPDIQTDNPLNGPDNSDRVPSEGSSNTSDPLLSDSSEPPIELYSNDSELRTEAGCLSALNNLFKSNEKLIQTVSVYAAGDAAWVPLSYFGVGVNGAQTGFVGQLLAQQLYSSSAMGLAVLGHGLAYRYGLKKEVPALDMFALWLAGSATICIWDASVQYAVYLFKNLGYSNKASAYLSSIFAGIAEGPTQYVLIKLIKLLADDAEYREFRRHPQKYLEKVIAEFGLSLTIGAIPGALWQILFTAASTGGIGPVATTFAVVLSVAVASVGSAKANDVIINSSCCQSIMNTIAGPFACGFCEANEEVAKKPDDYRALFSRFSCFGAGTEEPSALGAEEGKTEISLSTVHAMV